MSVPLSRRSSHLDVTFYVNLQGTPTGHVLLGRDVLTLEEARELAGRLEHACARLDALIAANTPEARAA